MCVYIYIHVYIYIYIYIYADTHTHIDADRLVARRRRALPELVPASTMEIREWCARRIERLIFLRPFSYLHLSYLRCKSPDFEQTHLKIVLKTSRDHLLV